MKRGGSGLEKYALKTRHQGRLTGVGLGVQAIPDSFILVHGGLACKYKGTAQFHLHDLSRPDHRALAYTEVTGLDLVKGSAARIGPYVRSWAHRREPALMVVATNTFLEMTGEDFGKAVREAGKTVPCETAHIRCLGFDGDLYEGYAAVTAEVLKRVPFGTTEPDPLKASILGNLFDRHEMDQAANLRQLEFLLRSIGLTPGPVLLSGRPYGDLMGAASAGLLLALPYLRPRLDEARAAAGRPVRELDLPVGIAGTIRWLKDAASAARVRREVLEHAVDRQLAFAAAGLDGFRRTAGDMIGKRTAVFADTPLAAGLATLLTEAGLPPVLVGLSDASLGGEKAFREAAARTGVELPPDLRVLERPSIRAAKAELGALCSGKRLAAAVGSSVELNCLPEDARVSRVELGFPSTTHHPLVPAPFYGIPGAISILCRVLGRSS